MKAKKTGIAIAMKLISYSSMKLTVASLIIGAIPILETQLEFLELPLFSKKCPKDSDHMVQKQTTWRMAAYPRIRRVRPASPRDQWLWSSNMKRGGRIFSMVKMMDASTLSDE